MGALGKRAGILRIKTGGGSPVTYVVKLETADFSFSGGPDIQEVFSRGSRDESDVVTYRAGTDPVYTGQITVGIRADKLESTDRAAWLAVREILRGRSSYIDPTDGATVAMTPTGGELSHPRWTVELFYDLSAIPSTTKNMLITLLNVEFTNRTETEADLYTIQASFNARAEPVTSYPAQA